MVQVQAFFLYYGADVKLAQAAMRRQQRRRRPTQEELDESDQPNADDIVDISYVGPNIPSRTFRCLQEAIGARNPHGRHFKYVGMFNV
jgi:hypothetical protein